MQKVIKSNDLVKYQVEVQKESVIIYVGDVSWLYTKRAIW